MIASEVNAVSRVLREGGIEVTALHNHLLNETPRNRAARSGGIVLRSESPASISSGSKTAWTLSSAI
jgi:hypothetical protein